MNENLLRNILFWGVWLLIPFLADILSGLAGSITVFVKYFRQKNYSYGYYPHVSVMVPVYNSQATLFKCLKSICSQDYPLKNISVFLINNGKFDSSFDIFNDFSQENPQLKLWWINSSEGKAKALNKGLYMSEGKYIINIDSDGVLDKSAIRNIVEKFEGDADIYALTGVILTDWNIIKKTSAPLLRLFQQCELFEYCEAFMIGRNSQSETNTMFTLAGAFSCYRKEAVLKTQLYNNETVGEDTHMTSQIRKFTQGKIALCENAFFYTEPIESLNKLYIQRQRWQRGQLEVSSLFSSVSESKHGFSHSFRHGFRHCFSKSKVKKGLNFVLKFNIIKDHTLLFPRFIWIFAMIYLIFLDYPPELIIGANIIIYAVYVLCSLLFFLISCLFLRNKKGLLEYLIKHSYIILFLPFYRFLIFFIRTAGVINSVEKYSSWNTKTFSEEKLIIFNKIKGKLNIYFKIKDWINNG